MSWGRWLVTVVAVTGMAGCNAPPAAPGDGGPTDASSDGSAGDGSLVDATLSIDATLVVDAQSADAGCVLCDGVCPGPDAFDSDPLNCGTCGHDCFGGPCTMGVCGPVEIVTAVYAMDIAVDGSYVYWIGMVNGEVRRRLKDASAPSELLATGPDLQSLAVDATHVYFTTLDYGPPFTSEVWRVVKDGSAPAEFLGDIVGGAGRMALDATHVYVATWGDTLGVGGVTSVLKTGGSELLLTSGVSVIDVKVDATDVYFSGDSATGTNHYVVSKTAKGGGGPVTLLASGPTESYPFSLALGGGNLYVGWQGPLPGALGLSRIALATGVVTNVQAGMGVRDVAADATGVFWGTNGIDKIWTRNHTGVGGIEIATAINHPWSLAVDSDSVYWSTEGTVSGPGNIYRLAR